VAEIDVRTVIGLLAITNIFLSLVMVLYWRTQRVYPGFGLWTLCNLTVALVWIVFFVRGSLPLGVAILVPNTLASLATVLRLEGLRRFLGRVRFDYRVVAVPVVVCVLMVLFVWVRNDEYVRTAVSTLVVAAVIWSMAALVIARARGSHRLTYVVPGIIWFLYGALNVARGSYWLSVREGSTLF
jgi:hypothetical protein